MYGYNLSADLAKFSKSLMLPAIAASAGRLLSRLLAWSEIARQRRELLRLDDKLLKDIGLSRADAEREASRPFWSV